MSVWLIPAIVMVIAMVLLVIVAAHGVYRDRRELRHWADEQRRKR